MRIRSVMLFVKDLEKVARFYEEKLELIRVGEPIDGFLELEAGNVRIALHEAKWSNGDNSDSPVKIVFECDDVRATVSRLEKKGVEFGKVFDWNGFSFADTKDPENNPLQISSRPQ